MEVDDESRVWSFSKNSHSVIVPKGPRLFGTSNPDHSHIHTDPVDRQRRSVATSIFPKDLSRLFRYGTNLVKKHPYSKNPSGWTMTSLDKFYGVSIVENVRDFLRSVVRGVE